MPTRNGIMLLLHAIKGFKVLYENVGYFTVDPRMVVFNCKGECKVWMHEQLNVIGVLSDVVTINSDEPNIRSQFIR